MLCRDREKERGGIRGEESLTREKREREGERKKERKKDKARRESHNQAYCGESSYILYLYSDRTGYKIDNYFFNT